MTTTRDPAPDEQLFYVVKPGGSIMWMEESFPTREAAIDAARQIGYGGPKFITMVVAVVED